jgi:hypothetical protein
VVDVDALTGAARPRFQVDGAQIGHVVGADDVEPVIAHEAQIGRILFGAEFLRQLVGNDGVLHHDVLPSVSLSVPQQQIERAGEPPTSL